MDQDHHSVDSNGSADRFGDRLSVISSASVGVRVCTLHCLLKLQDR